MKLNEEHISILDHTVNRAAMGCYCGGGKAMDELCEAGLMKFAGTVGWNPDRYYRITKEGRLALERQNEIRYFVWMFDAAFAPKVKSGAKRQTIRKLPKRMPSVGDNQSLRKWEGKAYRSKKQTLCEAPATLIQRIEIDPWGAMIDGEKLDNCDLEKFVRADGFEGYDAVEDFLDYFADRYDLPFQGIVIHW